MKIKSVKIGRNDPCPCGSGKNTNSAVGIRKRNSLKDTYKKQYNIILKPRPRSKGSGGRDGC